jgi:hypothetical protein
MSLGTLSENVIERVQSQPESNSVVVLHTLDSLLAAGLADLDGLYPTLDVLLGCKLQHLKHLGPVTDVRGSHVASIGYEGLRWHRRQRVIRQTYHVKCSVDLKSREVVGHIELSRVSCLQNHMPIGTKYLVSCVGRVDDKVELELVLLGPVVLACINETLCAKLHRVVLLVGRVRDDVRLSAESV